MAAANPPSKGDSPMASSRKDLLIQRTFASVSR